MTATTAIEKLQVGPQQTRTDFGVGASETAAAIGVSDYRGPIDVWLVQTGRREPFAGNEKTFWGNVLEGPIRAHYVERHGVAVYVPKNSLYHSELKFLRATPDGIVLDAEGNWLHVGPQVKNVGLRMAPAWTAEGERVTPIDYFVQGVVEMAVTNLPRIDFAILLGGQEYFEVTIERDKAIEGDVLEQVQKFWQLVESGTQPTLDASESFRGHLLRQIKRRAHTPATSADLEKLMRWRGIAVQMKQLKQAESQIKNEIAAELATRDAHRMTSDIGDITVGAPRNKTSWKSIAEDLARNIGTVVRLDRELAFLTTTTLPVETVRERITELRGQLQLSGALTDFRDVVARHVTHGNPSLNRPRSWTKDVGGDGDDQEES